VGSGSVNEKKPERATASKFTWDGRAQSVTET